MISIALYKPDIPQNTAAIIRFASCFGMKIHIIEPCSLGWTIKDLLGRHGLYGYQHLYRYSDFKNFKDNNKNHGSFC